MFSLSKKTYLKFGLCLMVALVIVWFLSPIFAFVGYIVSTLGLGILFYFYANKLAEDKNWKWWLDN